jgi:two-component system, LytTR family, response regulator
MYKVILIDDEHLARQLIGSYLQRHPGFEVVAECADGFEGFKAIQEHQPDLIFLDIQMPRLNGFEMLELLDRKPSVVFTTAFDEYALKAFEAHAIDYLLKPVVKDRFDKAVEKWIATAPAREVQPGLVPLLENNIYEGYQHRVVVKDNGLIRIIPAQEIHYIEADDDYIRIVTKAGTYLKKSTLSHIEQTLDPQQFVRVHRSFLVPVTQLMRIEPYEKESHLALLHCGAKVAVSKTGMAKLKALLGW